jgi:hypothetical protein
MSLLWAVPPVAVAIGAVLAVLQLRAMADATADLAAQLHRLQEVRVAVATVRAESAAARSTLHGLRSR